MDALFELDVVRVTRLLTSERAFDGTQGFARSPQAGDVGTIVLAAPASSETLGYQVECVDERGYTLWLAWFAREELQLVRRSEGMRTTTRASTRLDRYRQADRRPPGFRLFLLSVVIACIGLVLLEVGIGAAFGRAGNWSSHVVEAGIVCIVFAAAGNLVALVTAVVQTITRRSAARWYWLAILLVAPVSSLVSWLLL